MRRGFLAALAAMLLGPAVSVAGPPAAARDCYGKTLHFPSCVAGTYLGEVTLDMGLKFQSLNTFGADGTYVTESTLDFGAGGAAAAMAFRSGGRGQWEVMGPRKLKMTYLHFAYDGTGALLWVEKISVAATFTRSCSSVAGEATYAIYPPGLDPFEDDPVFGGSATLVMKRLPRD
jgi:hypothetical protein